MGPNFATCRKVCRTASEMLRDRGFTTEPPEQSQEDIVIYGSKNSKNVIFRLFFASKMSVDIARKSAAECSENTQVIVCAFSRPTYMAKQVLLDNNVEFFETSHLLQNITKHSLVPQHSKLSAKEVQQLLSGVRCALSQLPKILRSDPVVRYYDFPVDSVIRIARKSGRQPKTYAYRVVIDG